MNDICAGHVDLSAQQLIYFEWSLDAWQWKTKLQNFGQHHTHVVPYWPLFDPSPFLIHHWWHQSILKVVVPDNDEFCSWICVWSGSISRIVWLTVDESAELISRLVLLWVISPCIQRFILHFIWMNIASLLQHLRHLMKCNFSLVQKEPICWWQALSVNDHGKKAPVF